MFSHQRARPDSRYQSSQRTFTKISQSRKRPLPSKASPASAITLKNLLRHYAKQMLTHGPQIVKLGRQRRGLLCDCGVGGCQLFCLQLATWKKMHIYFLMINFMFHPTVYSLFPLPTFPFSAPLQYALFSHPQNDQLGRIQEDLLHNVFSDRRVGKWQHCSNLGNMPPSQHH